MRRLFYALGDARLRRWMAAGRPLARADGGGLTFTLSANGTATWVMRYSRGPHRRELTIGQYPDLSLAAARKAARTLRAAIDSGADPAAEKKTEKARTALAWTVNQLCDDFIEKHLVPPLARETIDGHIWQIDHFIRPRLGSLEVRNVLPSDLVYALEHGGRSWSITKKALTTMKLAFRHAVGKRIIDVNPAVGIELTAILGKKPAVRKRLMLTEDELRFLLPDIDSRIGRENGLMFRILLATCVRTSELAKARKEYIDLERGQWFVYDEAVKTRTGFLVPLVPVVIGWLRELTAMSGDSAWLLPTRHAKRRARYGDIHIGRKTLWGAFEYAFRQNRIDMRRFTPHDTRSTAKSHLRNMGFSREITEIALNHKLKGMEGIYDVREEMPERRRAMEVWAALVADCCDGHEPIVEHSTNVVPFRKAG
ncbi:MAG TPA: integrase family protein [Paraburkholderia sp.]|nr:integrase family protein [Paraburkholderia sp.]